jgi:hypothetical protein
VIDIAATFEKFEDEFLKFERVPAERRVSTRPDLCAFMLLDRLVPSDRARDILVSAEHDEVWLDVDLDALAGAASEDDILTLVRCGVRLDSDVESLAMFV